MSLFYERQHFKKKHILVAMVKSYRWSKLKNLPILALWLTYYYPLASHWTLIQSKLLAGATNLAGIQPQHLVFPSSPCPVLCTLELRLNWGPLGKFSIYPVSYAFLLDFVYMFPSHHTSDSINAAPSEEASLICN